MIDSQIWIYYFDPAAPENRYVTAWFEGDAKNGVLFRENIALSAIVPLEIAHNLYRLTKIDVEKTEAMIFSLLSMTNIRLFEIDQMTVSEALGILKKLRGSGIGGRDALILAAMRLNNITSLVTHDKNMLTIIDITRIDPVIDPPLVLVPDEEFNPKKFK